MVDQSVLALLLNGTPSSCRHGSQPITRIDGCCASTASGHTSAKPPMTVMKSRLFTLLPFGSDEKSSSTVDRDESPLVGLPRWGSEHLPFSAAPDVRKMIPENQFS